MMLRPTLEIECYSANDSMILREVPGERIACTVDDANSSFGGVAIDKAHNLAERDIRMMKIKTNSVRLFSTRFFLLDCLQETSIIPLRLYSIV